MNPPLPSSNDPANVVPLGTTALSKPDALLEELNVVRLEGRYFSFDKHEAMKSVGIYEYRDGNRGVIIETNPRYGRPSIIAYRVLQAIFRKITLEGKPYPDTVAFSYRELARMIGRDIIGGNDSRQLFRAIRQLEDTKIELFLYDPASGKRQQFESRRFALLTESGLIGEGSTTNPNHLKAAVLTVHPRIMESIHRGHYAIFNWIRLSQLEPIAASLYKRVYLHFANLYENKHTKDSLVFEKSYEDICAEWLGGLKPEAFKSRIAQQLGRHLRTVQETGLIRAVVIDKMADGKRFKLVFKPAAGFFSDYAHFYAKSGSRLLQFQEAADRAHLKTPYTAVRAFYKRTLQIEDAALNEMVFSENDIAFARQMIEQFGEDGFRDLIDYAIEEAPKTRFTMHSIQAVKTYLLRWQQERAQRSKRLDAKRHDEVKHKRAKLEDDYGDFKKHIIFEYLEKCSDTERAEIRKLAEEKVDTEYPPEHAMRRMVLSATERTLVLERCNVASFEEWLHSRV